MTPSPFSPARLRELAVVQDWRLDQIATLAGALLEEPVDGATVEAWLAEAGIAQPRPERKPPPTAPLKKRRRPGEGRITLPCGWCGVLVDRTPSQVREGQGVYCDPEHMRFGRARDAEERRRVRRTPAIGGLKVCPSCPPEVGPQPLDAFSVDIRRADGRNRVCLACVRASCKAYYLANRERLQTKARERARGKRS